jgi:pimeloyl-ACP methyl ester carboxylesterase
MTPSLNRSSAYTSAMFSETRYALNGDLNVAYRASREGPRDVVFVPNWFTTCELFPELPSISGWVEAMTALGRLIFLDQPGTGASDPVEPGALPTLEQWTDSITAVLDALGSSQAVLITAPGAIATAALFGLANGFRVEAESTVDSMGVDAFVVKASAPGPSWVPHHSPQVDLTRVASMPGVKAVAPLACAPSWFQCA